MRGNVSRRTTSKITPVVFITTLIKHDWTQGTKSHKDSLTPVSNECLNFYRQFEKAFKLMRRPNR